MQTAHTTRGRLELGRVAGSGAPAQPHALSQAVTLPWIVAQEIPTAARNLSRPGLMLCARCEGLLQRGLYLRAASSAARLWGAQRIRDLMCASCGAILTGEDLAQRLLRKQAQLAQFGLGAGQPLLKPHLAGDT